MTNEVIKTVNNLFKTIICNTLIENGFTYVKNKTAWRWNEDTIWVFEMSALGKHLSYSSGWPSSSLRVNLGIYYKYLPHPFEELNKPYVNRDGVLCPKEISCNRRGQLYCSYNQESFTKNVSRNEKEMKRRDVWWVEPDCSNVNDVINDINQVLQQIGMKWFLEKSNKELSILEQDKLKGYIIEKIDATV